MTGPRDQRFCLPGDRGWSARPGPVDGGGPGPAMAAGRASTVQCSNPGCGLEFTVPAGADWACPACGVNGRTGDGVVPVARPTPVPSPPPGPGVPVRAVEAPTAGPRPEAPSPAPDALPTVRTGCIGRGNAGKTVLFRALADGPVGDFLPSGLHVDAGDPREVARMIRESEQTQRLLHLAGLPPTRVAAPIRYYLYEGAERRATYDLREVIGQVLTHTLPDSAAEQQAHYDEYLANLVGTHVLWAVVPCPSPRPGSRERRRYANDLRITMAYLREAVRSRPAGRPAAVALVLSKLDTLFASAAEARAALTDPVLERALGPLVDLVRTSGHVSEAAIIPVTAFGFGTAVVAEGPGPRAGALPDAEDEPFGAEPSWVLREGVDPVPYNLDALFLWTLLFGLRGQEGTGAVDPDGQVRRLDHQLQDDLEAADPWILPLK